MSNPRVTNIRRTNGVAGQFQYSAELHYPHEGSARTVTFVGTAYGPSVVMVTKSTPEGIRVTDPERFGDKLSPEWIRRFFA